MSEEVDPKYSEAESEDSHELLGLERGDLEKAALLYENIKVQTIYKKKKSNEDFIEK